MVCRRDVCIREHETLNQWVLLRTGHVLFGPSYAHIIWLCSASSEFGVQCSWPSQIQYAICPEGLNNIAKPPDAMLVA